MARESYQLGGSIKDTYYWSWYYGSDNSKYHGAPYPNHRGKDISEVPWLEFSVGDFYDIHFYGSNAPWSDKDCEWLMESAAYQDAYNAANEYWSDHKWFCQLLYDFWDQMEEYDSEEHYKDDTIWSPKMYECVKFFLDSNNPSATVWGTKCGGLGPAAETWAQKVVSKSEEIYGLGDGDLASVPEEFQSEEGFRKRVWQKTNIFVKSGLKIPSRIGSIVPGPGFKELWWYQAPPESQNSSEAGSWKDSVDYLRGFIWFTQLYRLTGGMSDTYYYGIYHAPCGYKPKFDHTGSGNAFWVYEAEVSNPANSWTADIASKAGFYMTDKNSSAQPTLSQPKGLDGKDFTQLETWYESLRDELRSYSSCMVNCVWYDSFYEYRSIAIERRINYAFKSYMGWLEKSTRGELPEGAPISKRYRDWWEEYTTALAYALAIQFLCWSQNAEAFALFKEIKSNEDSLNSWAANADLDQIVKDAKNADSDNLDENAGAAGGRGETDEELTDQEVEDRQVFLKQCALLTNLSLLRDQFQNDIRIERKREKKGGFHARRKKRNYGIYRDLIHMLDCEKDRDKNTIINSLVAPTGQSIRAFTMMPPEIQACLIPKIRLFKVYNKTDSGGTDESLLEEVEFAFSNHMPQNETGFRASTKNDFSKGGQSGVKEFNFSFEGSTPATARKDIKASLTLYFQDFKEFVAERHEGDLFGNKGQGRKFKYVELILLPGSAAGKKKKDKEKLWADASSPFAIDPQNFRIRADVGWMVRDDSQFNKIVDEMKSGGKYSYKVHPDLISGQAIKDAINKTNKSFYLNMVDHDIQFQEDGSVEIKIDYRAYLESVFKTPRLDALTTPDLARERALLNEEHKLIVEKKICKPSDRSSHSGKAMEDLLAAYNEIEDSFIKRSHQSFIQRLILHEKLYYCFLDNKAVQRFARHGYFAERPGLSFSSSEFGITVGTAAEVDLETQVENEHSPTEKKSKQVFLDTSLANFIPADPGTPSVMVTFFYLGDLLMEALDCMIDPKTVNPKTPGTGKRYPYLRNTKFLLGTFDYIDMNGELRSANIAEIPVATEYFFEWMNENVLKEERKNYPVAFFIRDLCNKLIVELMQEVCVNRKAEKSLRFNTMNLLGVGRNKSGAMDPFNVMPFISKTCRINTSAAYKDNLLPLDGNIDNGGGINSMFNYFVIYPVTQTILNMNTGKRTDDEERGIYHFEIGNNIGLLKRVSFEKTDIAYVREARFFNHGHDGLLQLGAVYSVELEMFGNTIFYPGMHIFLDPRQMGGTEFDPTIGAGPNKKKTPSIANALGIGGYHLITRVESNMGPGKFSTTVTAQFVYSGDGTTSQVSHGGKQKRTPAELGDETAEDLLQAMDPNKMRGACRKIVAIREQHAWNIGDTDFSRNWASESGRAQRKFLESKRSSPDDSGE